MARGFLVQDKKYVQETASWYVCMSDRQKRRIPENVWTVEPKRDTTEITVGTLLCRRMKF